MRELAGQEGGEVVGVLLLEGLPAAAGEQDGAGADRVHPDVVRRQFLGGGRGEVDLRGLGGRVGGARRRAHAGVRGDDHHGTAARGAQVGQAGPDQLGGVACVERERGGELAGGRGGEVAAADRPAGVGHQVIEAAERGRDLFHGTAQRRCVGDIGRCGHHRRVPAGQAPGRVGQAGRVTGDEPDRGPLGGKRVRDREADALASPGDQHAAATQSKIHGHDYLRAVRTMRW